MSTRLAGHELWSEGAAFVMRESDAGRPQRIYYRTTGGKGFAVCSCGRKSPVLPSASARKQWHREHKDQWRGMQQESGVGH